MGNAPVCEPVCEGCEQQNGGPCSDHPVYEYNNEAAYKEASIGTQISIMQEQQEKDPLAFPEETAAFLTLEQLKCNVVAMKLTVNGLDTERILATSDGAPVPIKGRVEKALREALARHSSGVDPSYIHLMLSDGIVVWATVVPPEGSSVSLSQLQLGLSRRRVVEASVVAALKEVEGIDDVAIGQIACSAGDPFPDEWKEATTVDGLPYYWSVKVRTTAWQDPRKALREETEKPEMEEALVAGGPVIVDETECMVLTFLTADKEPQERAATFYVQPIDVVWVQNRDMPIKVNDVLKNGRADMQGVKKKWTLSKVNGENVKDGLEFPEAVAILSAALRKLPNSGDEKRTFA
mmetsp:Transcript_27224/g.49979  ORF Transcript_27224/g.49979 Transcript_27224/m.49979 type:complete len:350 (+) Transcript_27224:140-1189(+)